MYLLLHNSDKDFKIDLPTEKFFKVNINEFYQVVDEKDYLFTTNREEFFVNLVTESVDDIKYKDVLAIIIDKNLGVSGWSRAMALAGHLVTTKYLNCRLNQVPIILTDWSDLSINDISLTSTIINNFFQTEGFYFKKYEEIFSIGFEKSSQQQQYLIDSVIKKLKPASFDRINISTPYDNRHQSTNEWGAMRLSYNFGIYDQVNFKYPKHLYFKYLTNFIQKPTSEQDKTLYNLFQSILLIDDNADCGWVEVLELIFSCKVEKKVTTSEVTVWQNTVPEKFKNYDLIFLDLYLEKGKSDSSSALRILNFIKVKFPQIPVIIFTASDKAINLDKILERGADGMIIKESPLFLKTPNYSINNFNDFKKTIKYISEKYKVLRPYWVAIQEILSDQNFQNIKNTPSFKIKSRIEERLRMFFGLLKKGYEQWEYDKQAFFYSDYELAFMTLWSILNEIQEGFYLKTRPKLSLTKSDGEIVSYHPNKNEIICDKRHCKWEIDSKIFIDYDITFRFDDKNQVEAVNKNDYYELKYQQKSLIKFDRSKGIFEMTNQLEYTDFDYQEKLQNQIAGIFLLKDSLCNQPNLPQYLTNLNLLTKLRNSLYLTHGNNIEASFYQTTEEQKRWVFKNGNRINNPTYEIFPNKKIKDLFEMIFILLTDQPLTLII